MKGKKVRISFADLKKKNQTAVRKAAIKVSGAKGTVTYAKKKGSKKVTVKITGKARSVKNVYKNTAVAKVTSAKTASKIRVKGLKKGQTTIKIRVNGVWLKLKVNVKGK